MEELGANIHKIRLERGMTQSELAMWAGISRGMIGHIEKGQKNPKVATLAKIALALHTSIDSLLHQE